MLQPPNPAPPAEMPTTHCTNKNIPQNSPVLKSMALDHPNTIQRTEIIRFNALKRRPPSPARPPLSPAKVRNPVTPTNRFPHPLLKITRGLPLPRASLEPGVALASRRTRPAPAPRVTRAPPPANAPCGLQPPPPGRARRGLRGPTAATGTRAQGEEEVP